MIGPIGPTRPPPPQNDNESDSDDYSPSLPPEMISARSAPKVLGPSLPPSSYTAPKQITKKETPLSATYSDDDDFGPMPAPAGSSALNDGVREFREREEREEEKKKAASGKGPMKREEWMLVPPKNMGLQASMLDTTKLKSRGFNSAGPVVDPRAEEGIDLWTETPKERRERMEDEMLGKKSRAEIGRGGGNAPEVVTDEERRKRKRDNELRGEVERHNKSARATTLYDSHSRSSKKDSKELDGGSEIWDRDRDMSITGRVMNDGKRNDIVKQAKELGGRFGGGSYL